LEALEGIILYPLESSGFSSTVQSRLSFDDDEISLIRTAKSLTKILIKNVCTETPLSVSSLYFTVVEVKASLH